MSKTSKTEFFQRIFEESIKGKNKKYPFFIPCNVLKKTVESKIADVIKDVIANSAESIINKTILAYSKEGIVLKPNFYSLQFSPTIKLHLSDEVWDYVLSIADEYGFEQQIWHDMSILVCNYNNENLCPFLNSYHKILIEILSKYGHILFYGGELFTKQEENRNDFVYNAFSIDSAQLESININTFKQKISFSIDQLKYFAECIGKTIVRQVYSDALATIECLDIC